MSVGYNLKNRIRDAVFGVLLCFIAACFAPTETFSQGAGVNTLSPDPSAIFDITSTDKGLLIPRLTTAQRSAIVNPATGLLVYNTTSNQFEYNAGTPGSPSWLTLIDATSVAQSSWSTTGNAGTNVATGFLGTTDAVGLSIRTNNTERIRVTPTGSVGIGEANPTGVFAVGAGSPFSVSATGDVDANSVTASTGAFASTVGIGVTPQQTLDVAGGLRIGTTTANVAGSLRWTGTDFEGYDGSQWSSLTQSSFLGTPWDVTGNTVTASHFLGSLNNADVFIRANNTTTAVFAASGSIRRSNDGNARGLNAIDWQNSRTAATQVASGTNSVLLGGADNTASSDYGVVGGYNNAATGAFSGIPAGRNLTLGAESFGFHSGVTAVDWSATSGIAALGNVDLLLYNNDNSASQLRLYEPGVSPTTDNYSAFVARTQVADLIYELPALAPTTTAQVLAVENIGGTIQLEWASVSGGSGGLGLSGTAGEVPFFQTSTTLTSTSEFYWDNSTKRLGLGTAAPSHQLHLTEGLRVGNSTNAIAGAIRWTGGDFQGYNGVLWASLTADNASGGTWNVTGNSLTGTQFLGSQNARALRIRTNNIERVVVSTAGNVGVGTDTPAAKFDVVGSVKIGTTGTVLAHVIKASVSKDIGSIGSGIGITTTFAVPGAEVGSSVSISPDQAIGNGLMISWARVSADDTVEVALFNASLFSINPPSMDFHITVIK